MLDINLNFKGIFNILTGKCPKRKQAPIMDFIHSLKGHSHESKIQSILQRLCNGTFDLCVLYKNTGNTHELISFYGDYNTTTTTNYNLLNVPIFINKSVGYYVMLMTLTKLKENYDKHTMEILKSLLSDSNI